MDGFHRRKLEHDHWPPVRLALKGFYLPVPDDKLPTEFHDERDDGFTVFLILLFVVDRFLNHEIGSQGSLPFKLR